ncbi:MAG: hypothetical protein Kow00123_27400 [Anaerolineales bacterium]
MRIGWRTIVGASVKGAEYKSTAETAETAEGLQRAERRAHSARDGRKIDNPRLSV